MYPLITCNPLTYVHLAIFMCVETYAEIRLEILSNKIHKMPQGPNVIGGGFIFIK